MKDIVEHYNKADIVLCEEGCFTVEGSLFSFQNIEACKKWIDEVNEKAVTTEFREGKFVNKLL